MSYTLNPDQVPKTNQEMEEKQIEEILRNEFGIESEVQIFASVTNPNKFDQLSIKSTSRYTYLVHKATANLKEKFKEFGIDYIYYFCKDA